MISEEELLKMILLNLLDSRDLIGYQFSHALGYATAEELKGITAAYAETHKPLGLPDEEVVKYVGYFIGLTRIENPPAELISVAFQCSEEQAARVLSLIAEKP
jgi:hypothetical protein